MRWYNIIVNKKVSDPIKEDKDMMYSEFVEGTGCKDNEHNYKVFKNLEIMYMNSDMTKSEIYEYGKKLVDNSKSEEELKREEEIRNEIWMCEEQIKDLKDDIERYQSYLSEAVTMDAKECYMECVRKYKKDIRTCRNKISTLRQLFG